MRKRCHAIAASNTSEKVKSSTDDDVISNCCCIERLSREREEDMEMMILSLNLSRHASTLRR